MASPISESSATNDELAEAIKLRAKYTHFRILVIGRANAGKTTVLKRVCNTDEEPCLYDEDGKNLLEPTEERGIHDVRRPFSFKSNPKFIFHDSPGFEKGGAEELEKVRAFIADSAEARDVMDQIHVIWFCFDPDVSRPLLQLEQDFFNEQRAGNVPVVAIFTKFDDLVVQVWDRDKDPDANENKARATLSERFEHPLGKCNFPPRAYVCLEALHEDEGNHQEQVGVLIEQTAASIDNLALKMLFVNIQQNNLKVCIRAAVNEYIFSDVKNIENLLRKAASWFRHCYHEEYDYGEKLGLIQFQMQGLGLQEWGSPLDFSLYKFANTMCDVIQADYQEPSMATLAGICICCEHSFWYTQQGLEANVSFVTAWKNYQKSAQGNIHQVIDVYVKSEGTGDWFIKKYKPSVKQCKEFADLILSNLLARPESAT